jgi:hypothetical protein
MISPRILICYSLEMDNDLALFPNAAKWQHKSSLLEVALHLKKLFKVLIKIQIFRILNSLYKKKCNMPNIPSKDV